MKMKKGNLLIECVLALLIVSTCVIIVYNLTKMESNILNLKEAKEMSKYWRNLERFKIFFPFEKPVDIVY